MSTPTSKFQGTKAPEALDATNPHPAVSSQVALVDFLCDSKVESAEVIRVGNQLPSIDGIHFGSMTGGFIQLEKGGGGTEEGRRSPRQNSKFCGTAPRNFGNKNQAWAAQVPSHRASMAGKRRAGNSVE